MTKTFKRGGHVEWNSEAGIVRSVIFKKVVSNVRIKGYVHQASKKEPPYFIKSYKTDHIAEVVVEPRVLGKDMSNAIGLVTSTSQLHITK